MERVTVFTANIGRKGTAAEARANLVKIKNSPLGVLNRVTGYQEIDEADPADEHGLLKELYPHSTFAGFQCNDPILLQHLNADATYLDKTCDGRAKVTPTRYCAQARVRIGELPPVIFMNGHYPFQAEDLRRDCNRAWTLLAHKWYERGFTVITTRDTNWHGRMPKLHPKERLLTDSGAIDRITVIEKNVSVRVAKRHMINLTIDGHNAVGLTLVLREAK